MIVIVEGIDRVGKTTLCNMLKNNFEIYKNKGIVEVSEMSNKEETDKMLKLLDLYSLMEGNVVFDRFHLSDFVYGCIERCYDEYEAYKMFSLIDEKLMKLNAVIIFVNPTNINMSSNEHGKDLSRHQSLFEKVYRSSVVRNKFQCTFNTLNEAETFIKLVMDKGDKA